MSRQFLDRCVRSIDHLFQKKNQLSYESRYDYLINTKMMIRELHQGGYQLSHIRDIKPKHVTFLINHWQKKELSNATIKNRMAQIRFIFKAIRKEKLLPKDNKELGISKRSYINTESKAIHQIDLSKFNNSLIRYSVQLQMLFGLRREEAIKFKVHLADQKTYIRLQASWTKGGIERTIPITTQEQRALLNELKAQCKRNQSLIPEDKSYSYQRQAYDHAVKEASYRNLHGLRHAYAQKRYFELTNDKTKDNGWQALLNGGKHRAELTSEQSVIDREARLIIADELGHSRIQICSIYLGV